MKTSIESINFRVDDSKIKSTVSPRVANSNVTLLQYIVGLVHNQQVQENVKLIDVHVGLRVNGIRKSG